MTLSLLTHSTGNRSLNELHRNQSIRYFYVGRFPHISEGLLQSLLSKKALKWFYGWKVWKHETLHGKLNVWQMLEATMNMLYVLLLLWHNLCALMIKMNENISHDILMKRPVFLYHRPVCGDAVVKYPGLTWCLRGHAKFCPPLTARTLVGWHTAKSQNWHTGQGVFKYIMHSRPESRPCHSYQTW